MPLIERLRRDTEFLHRQLESTDLARQLMAPDLCMEAYAQLLFEWGHAWVGLEFAARLTTPPIGIGQLAPASRSHLLDRDLRALSQCHRVAQPVAVADQASPSAPQFESPEALIGAYYVLKGSSLGAKVIAKHLKQTLALCESNGAAFFGAPDLDSMTWSRWVLAVNSILVDEPAKQRAVQGAQKAFEYLIERFMAASEARQGERFAGLAA